MDHLKDPGRGGLADAAPRAVALIVAGIVAGAGVMQAISLVRAPSAAGPGASIGVVRFAVTAPPNKLLGPPLVSPDGKMIAHWMFDRGAEDRQAATRLYLRRLDSLESVPVEGSEQAFAAAFGPGGNWLAFVAPVSPGSSKQKIFKVPVDGSAPPIAIADWPENIFAPSLLWSPEGDLLAMSAAPIHIHRFPDDARPPSAPVELNLGGIDPNVAMTRLLPGGRHALGATTVFEESGFRVDLVLIDLETATASVLLRDATHGAWSPTGHLVVSRGDKLLAVPFDLEQLAMTGGPVPIAAGLRTPDAWQGAWFDLSPGGILAYNPGGIGGSDRRLMIVNRDGEVREWSGTQRSFVGNFRISADGRRIAATVTVEGLYEIWASDVDSPRLRLAVAEKKMDCSGPTFSADGEQLAYTCNDNEGGAVYLRRIDGAGEPQVLLESDPNTFVFPLDFSPDGASLLAGRSSEGQVDLLLLPLGGDGPAEEPVVLFSGKVSAATLSPDGRLVAVVSDEAGKSEVYVRELLGNRLGPPHQVSADGGGGFPSWRRTSEPGTFELLYNKEGRVQQVSVTTDPALRFSEPRDTEIDLQELRSVGRRFHPDGRMFFVQSGEEEDVTRIHVVLNFHDEIRRLTATSN